MKARVVYTCPRTSAEQIEVGSHSIQFGGGVQGDGYCYRHQSFDCVENLTDEEREAVHEA